MSSYEEKPEKFDYRLSLKKDRKGFFARYLAFERWLNRPLAAIVVRMAYPTRITPDQLTIIAFIVSTAAAFLFSRGTPRSSLWAAVLVQLTLVLDCADGMLARAKNQCSRYGAYFDLFLDRISDFAVLLGVAIGYFRLKADWAHLSLSMLTIALYMLQVSLFYIFQLYSGSKSGESGEARALAIYYITVCGVLHRLDWIIYGLLAESVLNLIYRIGHFLYAGTQSHK
jgi:phosphatidylglycerophosphate synthase